MVSKSRIRGTRRERLHGLEGLLAVVGLEVIRYEVVSRSSRCQFSQSYPTNVR